MAHRYKVIHGGPYPHLITCTIVRWLPVFVSGPYFEIVLGSLQHLRENRGLVIHVYVVMPTHLHAIVTAQLDDLSALVRDLKKFTARAIYARAQSESNDVLVWLFERAASNDPRSRFKVWQDEFHPKAIDSPEVFLQKADYIHLNPVRKGLVKDPEKWYHSSAATYNLGVDGPLSIDVLEW